MLAEPPQDDNEERYRLARKLVEQLPQRQRDTILMKYEDGLSVEEIEKATGMSSTWNPKRRFSARPSTKSSTSTNT